MKTKDTICKTCSFSLWEDEFNQFGCLACYPSMLNRFRDQGCVLECYDENSTFTVIKNRQCLYHRTENWWQKKCEGLTFDQAEKVARSEIQCKFHTILISTNTDKTIKTINDILKQEKLPSLLSIVVPPFKNPDILAVRTVLEKSPLKWYIRLATSGDTNNIQKYVQLADLQNKCDFILLLDEKPLLYNLMKVEDCIVKGKQFAAIYENKGEYHGLLMPWAIYRYLKLDSENWFAQIFQEEGLITWKELEQD